MARAGESVEKTRPDTGHTREEGRRGENVPIRVASRSTNKCCDEEAASWGARLRSERGGPGRGGSSLTVSLSAYSACADDVRSAVATRE